jgi:tetratricopeptide (TPR) repeat protein
MKKFLFLTALFFIFIQVNSPAQSATDYYNSGVAKKDAGDEYGALTDLTNAITLNPGYQQAYFERGRVKDNIKDYAGAVEDYTSAIQLNPNDAASYFLRGNDKWGFLDDKDGGCKDLNRADELGSPLASAWMSVYKCK